MKKFLKAILLSSLFVVISAASVFAADGNVTVSFTDGEGAPVTELTVGETATMSITIAMADGSSLAIADMPYTLTGIKTTTQNAGTGVTWQESGFMFENYDGVDSATVTATVEATVAGTASITFDDTVAYMENTVCEPTDALVVTGNTLTVKGAGKEDVVIAKPSVENSSETNADGSYNAGVLASFEVTSANNEVSKVKFVLNNGTKDAEKEVALGTTVENGTVKVALNILNVPSGKTITVTSVTPVK